MAAPDFGRNLIDLFERSALREGDKPCLWAKSEGAYRSWSWHEVRQAADHLARAMRAKGLMPGDRVLLVAENSPKWAITDLAVMRAGGITVPAYTTSTIDDHAHTLKDSGARMVVVSGDKLASNVMPAINQTEHVAQILTFTPLAKNDPAATPVLSWSEALTLGEAAPAFTDDPAQTLDPDQTACLIYTSGTGGKPKGVMLTHTNIMSNVASAYELLTIIGLGDDVFLSFLPLSHAYEHTAGQFLPLAMGAQIYYAEGLETLTSNLTEAKPTIMACVPRLYEVMRQRILNTMGRQAGLKPFLFAKAIELGGKAYEQPGSLGPLERVFNSLLDHLVRKKVQDRFGGRMKALISGGAPLNYDVGLFFTALGLPLYQGYGQTECAPVISVNRPERVKLDTVGPALPGTEVKIAEDGEILVRSKAITPGYWQDERSTRQLIQNGWLHTGDVGVMDADGYITITDRKRDLIVNSGGDNIAPQRVEGVLNLEPEIGQVVVYGDKRPHLVALIVPDKDFVDGYARAEGRARSLQMLADDNDFQEVIGEAVKRANRRLSSVERIRRFRIMEAPFTIDNGTMTPTMKLKRRVIFESFKVEIADLYKGRT